MLFLNIKLAVLRLGDQELGFLPCWIRGICCSWILGLGIPGICSWSQIWDWASQGSAAAPTFGIGAVSLLNHRNLLFLLLDLGLGMPGICSCSLVWDWGCFCAGSVGSAVPAPRSGVGIHSLLDQKVLLLLLDLGLELFPCWKFGMGLGIWDGSCCTQSW